MHISLTAVLLGVDTFSIYKPSVALTLKHRTFPTSFETVVTTSTSFVFQPEKRAVATIIPARYGKQHTDRPEARGLSAESKCPSSQTATSLPCYADCGKKAAAYSSACSCLGVVGSTRTLSRATSTKTLTITKTTAASLTRTTTIKATQTAEVSATRSCSVP